INDNTPPNLTDPQPIGDTPPANGPTPIGDQGSAPDVPGKWGVGTNPDGGQTITYGGTRTTTEPGGGPTPINDNTPPNLTDPQPSGDTPPANGPTPIGDQGSAPDVPGKWGVGTNPDGGQTITYGGTRTTTEPGGGPTPINDNTPPNLTDPQPIGDTPPANGATPIGDQGSAPDVPGKWGVGTNPDGGQTITYGGTRTTTEPGGGPTPINDNTPPNLTDPQPIGDTPPANGPTPIGDQGSAPDVPGKWGVGTNPDGGQTITYGGTRTTTEPGGGPPPINEKKPPNRTEPRPIGATPPEKGPTPIGDQGSAPDVPGKWGVGTNPDGGQTITYGGTRTTTEPGGGPTPINDNTPPYLKKFLKSYPTVNVHVEYRRAKQVYEDVLGNVVDLGLVAYPVRDSKLEICPLRKDLLVLICHPQHPFAKSKSVRLKAIGGQKFISFETDIPTRKALDKILKEHSVHVQHVMEFDNIETVKRAVEIDAGIAIVPQGTVIQEVAKQTLVQVTFEDGEFYRPLAALYKKNKVLSPAMKQFLAVLKEEK